MAQKIILVVPRQIPVQRNAVNNIIAVKILCLLVIELTTKQPAHNKDYIRISEDFRAFCPALTFVLVDRNEARNPLLHITSNVIL